MEAHRPEVRPLHLRPMTAAELIARLAELPEWHLDVLSACDSDRGYAHALTGIRVVGDRVILDLDYDCEPEALGGD